jgi:phosphoglycerate dehydrogenase-like enzyme
MSALSIFCDAPLSDLALQILEQGVAPHKLVFSRRATGSVPARRDPDRALRAADVAFGQPDVANVMDSEKLRWIQVTSAGYTRYDTPDFRSWASGRRIIVTNSSAVYAEACAEHVFAFMLAQARALPQALGVPREEGSSRWTELRESCALLQGQSAVILGFGAIAARLLQLLSPFAMKIIAMRRKPRGDEKVAIVTPGNLRDALATADHVINILPDNAQSVEFISAERLGWVKPGAIFYNIGRGTTVNQQALGDSLQSGHLGAAWLDVTDPEPLPDDHPLWKAPNCHITPHIAGGHRNESAALVRHFLENFRRFLAGMRLRDRIM